MQCPACGHALTSTPIDDVTVDVCIGGCGGMWFDNFQIQKFDEPHDRRGDKLLEMDLDPQVTPSREGKRHCPRCELPMLEQFWSVRQEVQIDRCPGCNGLWLDLGDLARIRSMFDSAEERRKAAEQRFDELLSENAPSSPDGGSGGAPEGTEESR